MLRRVENVGAVLQRDLWGVIIGGRYKMHFSVGRKTTIFSVRTTPVEFNDRFARSGTHPQLFARVGERMYWRFQDRWYSDNENLTADDVHALLRARDSRRSDTVNRARTLAALDGPRTAQRTRRGIPDDVKQLVWARDRGRCRSCDADQELQYDHVIPFSMGGGSTEANLQLLCGPCNRRKGASLV